jgi:hypothetical protein
MSEILTLQLSCCLDAVVHACIDALRTCRCMYEQRPRYVTRLVALSLSIA